MHFDGDVREGLAFAKDLTPPAHLVRASRVRYHTRPEVLRLHTQLRPGAAAVVAFIVATSAELGALKRARQCATFALSVCARFAHLYPVETDLSVPPERVFCQP